MSTLPHVAHVAEIFKKIFSSRQDHLVIDITSVRESQLSQRWVSGWGGGTPNKGVGGMGGNGLDQVQRVHKGQFKVVLRIA